MSKGWLCLLEPGSLMPSFKSLRDGSWKCTCDLSVLTNSHHQSYTYHLYHPVSSFPFTTLQPDWLLLLACMRPMHMTAAAGTTPPLAVFSTGHVHFYSFRLFCPTAISFSTQVFILCLSVCLLLSPSFKNCSLYLSQCRWLLWSAHSFDTYVSRTH